MERLLAALDARAARRWAEALLDELGALGGVFAASPERIERLLGSAEAAALIANAAEASRLAARARLADKPLVGSPPELIDYLRLSQGHGGAETMRVLFLNARNLLIRDEVVGSGMIDEVAFCARAILKRCLELDAAAIVLVHNHPSGDAAPSLGDIAATRSLAGPCRQLGITLHDHIIVTGGAHTSMRAQNLI